MFQLIGGLKNLVLKGGSYTLKILKLNMLLSNVNIIESTLRIR